MEKTEKDIFKILTAVFAILIAAVVAGGGFLMFAAGNKAPGAVGKAESVKLQAEGPAKSEMELSSQLTVSANASSSSEKKEDDKKDAENKMSADYVLPESNARLMTESDVAGLSAQELNYAKNEIYARHGRKFKSKELQDYFGSKSWYEGVYEGDEFDQKYSINVLSDIEKKNAEFLKKKEYEASNGGYKLDQ